MESVTLGETWTIEPEVESETDLVKSDDFEPTPMPGVTWYNPKKKREPQVFGSFFGYVCSIILLGGSLVPLASFLLAIAGLGHELERWRCSNGVCRQLDPVDAPTAWGLIGGGLLLVGLPGLIYFSWRTRRALQLVETAGLEPLIGALVPHPALTAPAPVTQVCRALSHLNELDVPYALSAVRNKKNGVVNVTVMWRVQSHRWRSLLSTGGLRFGWSLHIKLRPDGRYTWHERISKKTYQVNLAGVHMNVRWFYGKTLGVSDGGIYAPGRFVGLDDKDLGITTSDVKVPVFSILRAYGWRPRTESLLNHVFEF